mgnify:CR=1 FL=1
MANPEQQGLKLNSLGQLPHGQMALMANPEQQGLKRNRPRRSRDRQTALMANPEQQGLKHRGTPSYSLPGGSP